MEYRVKVDNPIKDVKIVGGRKVVFEQTPAYKEIYERGFNEGRAQGIEEGITRGLQIGREETRAVKDKLESIINTFLKERDALIKGAELTMLKLVKVIAKKVIEREITMDSTIVLENIRQAISRTVGEDKVLVKVNPLDLEEVRGREKEWLGMVPNTHSFQIIGDESVSRGGCLIETFSGKIDATIESKFAKLVEIINGADSSLRSE